MSKRPIKLATPPLLLHGEALGTPRTMERRLAKEVERGERMLVRERGHREANTQAFEARDKELEAVYQLASLKNAIDAAYRALKKKMSGPKFKRPPTKEEKEAEAAAAERKTKAEAADAELKPSKQREAELKMIFRRYDEDDGGTIDNEELEKAFADMDKEDLVERIPELMGRFGSSEDAEEVTFAEFVTMVFETEKEKRRAEMKRAEAERRRTKEAENRVFVRLMPPFASPRDVVLEPAVKRAAVEAEQAALDALNALLAASMAGDAAAEKDAAAKQAAYPDWDQKVLTPWDRLPTAAAAAAADKGAKGKKGKGAKGGKGGDAGDGADDAGSGSVGAQQGVGQATANQQYCRLRRCVVAELGIFAAEDALRQLIVSRETRTSIDSGFKVYNDDKAWPLREAFPVPLLLHKRVEVLEQKFRYRAFIYNGELTALTQVDELAAHELELDELDELVQQLVEFFEKSKVTWVKVAAAYLSKKEDDGEGEGGGATDMLLDMQETEEEKEARMRAIFEKYDDDGGGSVDAAEMRPVFADLGIDQPDEDEMAEMIEEFAEGAEEVNFEQFCQIIDALEQDVTAKLRRVFNKYDEDGGGTMDAGELEKIFKDLGMAISNEQIDNAVFEYSGGEDEVDFEQFLTMVDELKKTIIREVEVEIRPFKKDDNIELKSFATDKLFDTEDEDPRIVEAKLRMIFDRYDEDRGGTIDGSELEKIFEDFGKSLSKDEIEELIEEYGGSDPEGVTFPEFVQMNEALPPSYEIPCVFRAVRDYLDEALYLTAKARDNPALGPPAYDGLAVDILVDTQRRQVERDREWSKSGVAAQGVPATKPWVTRVTPFTTAQLDSATADIDGGLFRISEEEDRNAIKGKMPPKPEIEVEDEKEARKKRAAQEAEAAKDPKAAAKRAKEEAAAKAAAEAKAAARAAALAAGEEEEESDDEREFGWVDKPDEHGVIKYQQKMAPGGPLTGRMFEFRVRQTELKSRELRTHLPAVAHGLLPYDEKSKEDLAKAKQGAKGKKATKVKKK